MPEEIFDVVDEQDQVTGQLPRSQVHERKLLHRAVHIFVFNTAGELLIHKRSATKDEQPNLWTSSASGHLAEGENYAETADREMAEEIGLTGELEFLYKFAATPETSREHVALYRMTSDDVPTFDPEEIAEGKYCSLAEIDEQIMQSREKFSSSFLVLYAWYRENYS